MTVLNKTSNISPNEVNDASSNIPLEVIVIKEVLLRPKEKQTFDAMTHFETDLFIPDQQKQGYVRRYTAKGINCS